jgi:hypothetical protein
MATKRETPEEALARNMAFTLAYTGLLDEIGGLLSIRLDNEVREQVGAGADAPGITTSTAGFLIRGNWLEIVRVYCASNALVNLLIAKGVFTEAEYQGALMAEIKRERDELKTIRGTRQDETGGA